MELTGSLLVATPLLSDPNFGRTVVLVVEHAPSGTLGVVLNRPTQVRVADVLEPWGELTTGPQVMFQGGPVALDSALAVGGVLGQPDDDEPLGWRRISEERVAGLGLVDLDAPPQVLAGELGSLRIFAGYAGWGAGQLEGEIDEGSWYVVEAEPGDPFTSDPERLWREVLRRQGGELSLVATFPEDPTQN
ncbi:MAG: YqgE/AlgH family protein [Streptosporangiales bacterium]|nr:YqgE/AlgH family protein [Streptosporangiales bacterium]